MTTFGEAFPKLVTSLRSASNKIHAATADGELACGTQLQLAVPLDQVAGISLTCRSCQIARINWRQERYEAADVAGMVRRGMRGLVRRAGAGDTEALRELVQLQATLQTAITEAGTRLHDHGHSYTLLAAELGVSRQAARQRFMRTAAPETVAV